MPTRYTKRTLLLQSIIRALSGIIDAIEPQGGQSGSSWAWAIFGEGDREWLRRGHQRELHDTICAEYFAMEYDLAVFYGRQGLDPYGNTPYEEAQ